MLVNRKAFRSQYFLNNFGLWEIKSLCFSYFYLNYVDMFGFSRYAY